MQKKIWEIHTLFHCPIVGVCLTMSDQRQILRKSGFKTKHMQEHDIHVTLIEHARKETTVAKRLEKVLNRQYRQEIAQWEGLTAEIWPSLFDAHFNAQTAGALLWFTAAYVELSQEQIYSIYGKMHMLLYSQFQAQQSLLRRCDRLETKHDDVNKKCHDMRRQLRGEQKLRQTLESQQTRKEKQIQTLLTENEMLKQRPEFEELQVQNNLLEERLQRIEGKLQTRTVAVNELKEERNQLKQQIHEQQSLLQGMEHELKKIFDQFRCAESQAALHCPNYALCERRILIVGGMTKLRAFYETLVTQMGGEFEYHDGYKYDGDEALSHLVDRSDVVLCPVDVNSHSACLNVKKFCKKMNKPYYMLHSSSISTIHNTLREVANSGQA